MMIGCLIDRLRVWSLISTLFVAAGCGSQAAASMTTQADFSPPIACMAMLSLQKQAVLERRESGDVQSFQRAYDAWRAQAVRQYSADQMQSLKREAERAFEDLPAVSVGDAAADCTLRAPRFG